MRHVDLRRVAATLASAVTQPDATGVGAAACHRSSWVPRHGQPVRPLFRAGPADCAILEGMDSPSASAPVSYPAVMVQRCRSRLPAALVDLSGPAHGTVQLPLHVAWSGQTAFDLDRAKPRMHMYRIVLAEGQLGVRVPRTRPYPTGS